jgi:hypothetical protein
MKLETREYDELAQDIDKIHALSKLITGLTIETSGEIQVDASGFFYFCEEIRKSAENAQKLILSKNG